MRLAEASVLWPGRQAKPDRRRRRPRDGLRLVGSTSGRGSGTEFGHRWAEPGFERCGPRERPRTGWLGWRGESTLSTKARGGVSR